MKARKHIWVTVGPNNPIVEQYVGPYTKAYCRILRKERPDNFNQFFQITFYKKDGSKNLRSFEVYTDEEEASIKEGVPNIQEHYFFFKD